MTDEQFVEWLMQRAGRSTTPFMDAYRKMRAEIAENYRVEPVGETVVVKFGGFLI